MNEFMQRKNLEGLNGSEIRSANALNDFIDKLINEEYELTELYVGNFRKVKLICPQGHEYFVTPNNFRRGRRCSKCSKLCPKQAKENFMKLIYKEKYKLISEYEFCNRKVKLRCPRGHEFYIIPQRFKQGGRCTYCNNKSYGEGLVRDLLEKYNIEYVREKSFSNLNGVGGHVLRFDFYIPCINTLIEVQGEEHYEEYTVDYFQGDTLEHDKLKRKYCKQNNIRLIEIPYLSAIYGREKALAKVEDKVIEIIKNIKIA